MVLYRVIVLTRSISIIGIRFSMGENMLETAQDGFAQELVPTDDDSCKASAFKNGSYSYLVVRKEVKYYCVDLLSISETSRMLRVNINFTVSIIFVFFL